VRTYGKGIMDTVRKTDGNAVVVDTEKDGRKDMVLLALKLYQESKAEAVIVISNTEGTYRVVRELESRGIPAYGSIWVS
jgi:ketopantoate hydroxymethyltransferase